MRMRFGRGDEKGFEKGSRLLLEQFERWLVERVGATSDEAADVVADASVALDWKWGYGDGNLGCWQPEELAEFLLEWCPRKLSVPQEECGGLPTAVQTLLRFLADSNLLDVACAPVPVLEEAIDRLAPGYVEAMGDPSKFGMAKSLFTTAAAEGVDLTDRAAAEEWIAGFNARHEEERRRVLPGPPAGPRQARRVLPWFEKSVGALLAAGALSSQRHPDAWLKWPEVDALLDGLVLPMLTTAYATQRPVPLDDIVEVVTDTVLEAFVFPALSDDQVARSVGADVTDIFDALELAGVRHPCRRRRARRDLGPAENGRDGGAHRRRCRARPAPFRRNWPRRPDRRPVRRPAGHRAAPGRQRHGPSDTLGRTRSLAPAANGRGRGAQPGRGDPRPRRRRPALRLWHARRHPARRERPARPPARSQPGRARRRPLLARRPGPRPRDVPLRARRSRTLHRCACPALRHRRPGSAVRHLGRRRQHDDQMAVIGTLWRSASPAPLPVLEAIGKTHTVVDPH